MGASQQCVFYLVVRGLAVALCLLGSGGCNDYLTGQDGEPSGPLRVTRLTLFDLGRSRGTAVFTDTSVPADCSLAEFRDASACLDNAFKDRYGILKSPPNPDSARSLRVVFNKSPLKLNGMALEPLPEEGLPTVLSLTDPSVIGLVCTGCSQDDQGNRGVPATYNSLQLTGTDQSPNPARYAYGPGLQMEAVTECETDNSDPCRLAGIAADPYRALEPDSTYSVVLNAGLSARIGDGSDTLLIDDAARSLLRFTTEAFKPLTVGIGDGKDNVVDGTAASGEGSPERPYRIDRPTADGKGEAVLDNGGAVQVSLNAAVDESVFSSQTATATVTVGDGTPTAVAVTVSNAKGAPLMCKFGSKRKLYIAPTSGSWLGQPVPGAVVRITLRGSELHDLSQLSGHPAGKGVHVVGRELTLEATLLDRPAGADYAGVMASAVVPPSGC